MAGNEDTDGIDPDGGADGAGGFGLADGFGDAAISRKLTGRNGEEGAPDADLEIGSANPGAEGGAVSSFRRKVLFQN